MGVTEGMVTMIHYSLALFLLVSTIVVTGCQHQPSPTGLFTGMSTDIGDYKMSDSPPPGLAVEGLEGANLSEIRARIMRANAK